MVVTKILSDKKEINTLHGKIIIGILLVEEISPDINKMIATKLKHIEELNWRHSLGHEHPFHHNPKKEH